MGITLDRSSLHHRDTQIKSRQPSIHIYRQLRISNPPSIHIFGVQEKCGENPDKCAEKKKKIYNPLPCPPFRSFSPVGYQQIATGLLLTDASQLHPNTWKQSIKHPLPPDTLEAHLKTSIHQEMRHRVMTSKTKMLDIWDGLILFKTFLLNAAQVIEKTAFTLMKRSNLTGCLDKIPRTGMNKAGWVQIKVQEDVYDPFSIFYKNKNKSLMFILICTENDTSELPASFSILCWLVVPMTCLFLCLL